MKTIILAGGFGTRLSEETIIKPKPMVEIGGMPILWHIMKTYSSNNYNDFIVALGYKGSFIKNYFINYMLHKSDISINLKSGNINYQRKIAEDWNIDLIETGDNSMTGGRLFRLKNKFKKGDTFMLTYGDGVCSVDINELVKFHKSHGKIATMTAVRPNARFGSISMNNQGLVSEFKEKPQVGEGWINGGFFVFEPGVFDFISDDSTLLEREPLEQISEKGELMVFQHPGYWQCMDTLRDKATLEDMWVNDKAPWKG